MLSPPCAAAGAEQAAPLGVLQELLRNDSAVAFSGLAKYFPIIHICRRGGAAPGGAWINNADNLRCAIRNRNHPDNRNNNIGFRLVLSV